MDLSNTNGYVTAKVFVDMANRVEAWLNNPKNKGEPPEIVYITKESPDSISWETYKSMFERRVKWHDTTGQWPDKIYFTAPKPTVTVGPIQNSVMNAIGTFTTFTGYYSLIKARGYKSYYNDIKTRTQTIEALQKRTGVNCTDIMQVTHDLAIEMGYECRYVHVMCKEGGHVRGQIKGREFGDWTRIDPAAAISVASQYPIGRVWCDYSNAHIEDSAWLNQDDGV